MLLDPLHNVPKSGEQMEVIILNMADLELASICSSLVTRRLISFQLIDTSLFYIHLET